MQLIKDAFINQIILFQLNRLEQSNNLLIPVRVEFDKNKVELEETKLRFDIDRNFMVLICFQLANL